jgi:prepilin-type N-terminal cleavage/methylation domain-containing protein
MRQAKQKLSQLSVKPKLRRLRYICTSDNPYAIVSILQISRVTLMTRSTNTDQIHKKGFTIVELIIVISIIAVLAGIVIIGYGGWKRTTIANQVKSDLNGIATAMENARNFGNGYPTATTLPADITTIAGLSTFKPSSGNTLMLAVGSTAAAYCIDTTNSQDASVQYYSDSNSSGGPQQGTCSTHPASTTLAIPTNLAFTSTAATQIGLSWNASVGGASSYMAECASDAAFVNGFRSSSTPSLAVTITGLEAITTHYCRIKAVNTSGSSYYSAIINTNTIAYQPPTNLAVSTTDNTSITLTWTANSDATSYTVQCALDSSFTSGMNQATTAGTSVSVASLTTHKTYYCHVNSVNPKGTSMWGSTLTTGTTTNFGTIAAPTGLYETAIGGRSTNVAWTGISCSLGTQLYRTVMVAPYAGTATGWNASTSATIAHDQTSTTTWTAQSECTFDGVYSSVTTSASHTFTSVVEPPSGSFGAIGWDNRWTYNANANTFTCGPGATEEYLLVKTLNDYTSGTWTYGWTTSTTITNTGSNQGARMTVYMQVRCRIGATSSTLVSSGSRTDNASVDAPGYVPGWCAGSCGSPRGDRWSAIGCPAGTYAIYWSYLVGDYSNVVWGAYQAAGFYGYDRGSYSVGNTMLNDYLKAQCTSDFITSGWGPSAYARY